MIFNFCFAIFLFVFNCGPFVFSENREFQKRLEDLRLKNVPEEQKDEAKEAYKESKSVYSNNTIGNVFRSGTNRSVSTHSLSRAPKGTFSGG
jgi:hypothetical protein